MKRLSLLAFIVSVLFSSCKERKITSIFSSDEEECEDTIESFAGDTLHLFEEEAPPVAVDELFDDFFFNFASDSRFQRERVANHLGYRDGEDEEHVPADSWRLLNRFEEQEFYTVIYERAQDLELQKDTAVNAVSVEWVSLVDGLVDRFNFHRLNGKWSLIEIVKEPLSQIPNGSFLQFYSQFVADSSFQHSAIYQPLKLVLTPESDGDEEQVEELTVEDWFEMKNDLPMPDESLVNIDYGQTCISDNRKVLLMEGVGNGLQMKFLFNKINGEWKLMQIDY